MDDRDYQDQMRLAGALIVISVLLIALLAYQLR